MYVGSFGGCKQVLGISGEVLGLENVAEAVCVCVGVSRNHKNQGLVECWDCAVFGKTKRCFWTGYSDLNWEWIWRCWEGQRGAVGLRVWQELLSCIGSLCLGRCQRPENYVLGGRVWMGPCYQRCRGYKAHVLEVPGF